jgi:hypothetical protein
MVGCWAQVAVEVSACLGAVGRAGRKPRVPPLAAGGEAQVVDEFSQHIRSDGMAAMRKTAEKAAKGVRDVASFQSITARYTSRHC